MFLQKAQTGFIYLAAPAGGNITAALFHITVHLLRIIAAIHIIERCDHHRIFLQITVHIQDIRIYPELPQRFKIGTKHILTA